jgi:hypothetical protein
MEGRDFGKRALQRVKNYEKGQYTCSYFQLLTIKNIFQHYIMYKMTIITEYASSSDSDEELPLVDQAWRGDGESDAESIDSEQEDYLK